MDLMGRLQLDTILGKERRGPGNLRRSADKCQMLVLKIFEILNYENRNNDSIHAILSMIKDYHGVEAVGIRLKRGNDFPYFEARGNPIEIVRYDKPFFSENGDHFLKPGKKCPVELNCLCGQILNRKIDTTLPNITKQGGFWTNNASRLFSERFSGERFNCLNACCISNGFESIALIPLYYCNEIVGLLQLNDNRNNVFSAETVSFYEELGNSIGIVLARKIAEDDRRKVEVEIIKAQRLESLGKLAGGIAHDFNNLLGGVYGYIETALEYGNPNETIKELLSTAMKSFNNAKKLTSQLMTFSNGNIQKKEILSVKTLIQEAIDLTNRDSRIKCNIVASHDLWDIEADKEQMTEALSKIIQNAIDAIPQSGLITIELDNILVTQDNMPQLKNGDYVSISIQDNGIGMPENILTKIFDPFFTYKKSGVGLGLTLSYSIIGKHKGHLSMDSLKGKGTKCTLYLPKAERPVKKHYKQIDEIYHGNGRILVMDDEDIIRKVITTILTKLGYCVHTVNDGDSAIEEYKQAFTAGKPYDAVILDLTVPGAKGGKETIVELLLFDQNIKAIVSSGYSEDPVFTNYKQYGFSDTLSKPYKIADLSRVLHNILAQNSIDSFKFN